MLFFFNLCIDVLGRQTFKSHISSIGRFLFLKRKLFLKKYTCGAHRTPHQEPHSARRRRRSSGSSAAAAAALRREKAFCTFDASGLRKKYDPRSRDPRGGRLWTETREGLSSREYVNETPSPTTLGGVDGGSHVACRFYEMPMSHASVAYSPHGTCQIQEKPMSLSL